MPDFFRETFIFFILLDNILFKKFKDKMNSVILGYK